MGHFRFRKSIRIFPGVRWNIGGRSSSLTFGGRGAHYTIGSRVTRFTWGIPGTGLSYTDVQSNHARVSSHPKWADIPPPSQEWLDANKQRIHFHFPDRRPDEPPAIPSQLEEIRSLGGVDEDFDWKTLGHDQGENLLFQMREARSRYSKQILRRYYREHGATVPSWFLDHVVDHPNEPLPGVPKKTHGCLMLIGILFLIGWINSLSRNGGTPSFQQSQNPPPSLPLKPSESASSPSFNPQAAKSPDSSASPRAVSQFPDPDFWPREVRISSPVLLSGVVDGGTIRQTAKPGAVLDATLSADHRTVILRRLDISGCLPVEQTDFMQRARRAESEERPH